MRIISPFKDYYDNVGVYDSDPKRVYERKTHSLQDTQFPEIVEILRHIPILQEDSKRFRHLHHGLVAFCGKAYPYYHFYKSDSAHSRNSLDSFRNLGSEGIPTSSYVCAYTFDAIRKFWEGMLEVPAEKKKAERILQSIQSKDSREFLRWSILTSKSWNDFINSSSMTLSDEIFRRANAPVINFSSVTTNFSEKYEVTTNPNLKNLGFASMVDPYTAYQEIEMFIGTNLVHQMDPEVHVPDEIKAESHGFNKFSFRKDPSKKGKKRRKSR